VAHGRGLPGLVVAIGHASGAIPPACRRHTPAGVRETARVDDLAPGLYEALIDEVLAGRLRELQPDIVEQRALRPTPPIACLASLPSRCAGSYPPCRTRIELRAVLR
jgi:hypothetical protein